MEIVKFTFPQCRTHPVEFFFQTTQSNMRTSGRKTEEPLGCTILER
jgi:hypothetical protein